MLSYPNSYEEEELILIGQVTRPHGIKGEVKVKSLTNDLHRFDLLDEVWVIYQDCPPASHNIQQVRYQQDFVLLKLAGCDTRHEAEQQVGAVLGIPKARLLPLSTDTYYQFEIIGLKVYTAEQCYLGRVEHILSTGSNDVYVVRNDSQEFLIPAIKQAIKQIDTKQGCVVLNNLKGLIDPHAR